MTTELPSFVPGVGADVDSLCSKCGDVRHVILTHKDGLVDRTQCKECGRKHKYKPTEQEIIDAIKAYKKAQKALLNPTAAKKKTTRTRKTTPKIEPVVIDQEAPVLNYSVKRIFQLHDQLDHPKFGLGIVHAIKESNKMEVHFVELGSKMLLFGRE